MTESGSSQTMRAQMLLREKILAGAIEPGTRLLEVSTAADLGISRTPVRDALSRLAEEGLLDRGERGGFLVRSFSLADVLDSIELRGVLEGTAARLAAERGVSLEKLADIETTVERIDDLIHTDHGITELDAYSKLNGKFHAQLWRLAESETLLRELDRVAMLPFASPSAFIHEQAGEDNFRMSLFSAQAQHRAIVDAIARRKGARAEGVTREHAWIARQNLEDALTSERISIRTAPSLALVVD